jgi:ABC-type sulfate transport system substrate-binding protein
MYALFSLSMQMLIARTYFRPQNQLIWLVLGGDPEDRFHTVEQFTAL